MILPMFDLQVFDRKDFSRFRSTSESDTSYEVLSQFGLSVQGKKHKIDFQDAVMAAILDFRSKAI